MIQSFKCKDTQAMFSGKLVARWVNLAQVAERKLQMLHRAVALSDLLAPPGNRLEALHGNRKGQHSIRVNDQWRVCFIWTDNGPADVEIVDYH
jgi:proteic killer suppression protein